MSELTVRQLCQLFELHAETYYRKPSGRPTRSANNIRDANRELCWTPWPKRIPGEEPSPTTLADAPASEMTAKALYHVQQTMASSGRLCRRSVNDRVAWIKTMFRWAAHPEQEIVPEMVPARLGLVTALRIGRSGALESPGTSAVLESDVRATIRHSNERLSAMIAAHWGTGMRPGELCIMSKSAIDMSGDPWLYTPAEHKCEHFNKPRVIPVWRRAQEALTPLMLKTKTDFLFEREGKPILPGSYRNAITRTNKRFGLKNWKPNQIRHSFATRISEKYDRRTASILLGHSSERTTEIYDHADFRKMIDRLRPELG